jgi:hypothetical protein
MTLPIQGLVMLNSFQHPSGGNRLAAEWTLKQVQGDELRIVRVRS